MPAPTLAPNNPKQDESNPGQRHADQTFSGLADAEKRGTADMSAFEDDYASDKSAADAPSTPDEYAAQKLKDKESAGDAAGTWGNNVTPKSDKVKLPWYRRKGTWFGVGGGGLGIAGLIVGGGMLPMFLFPSISQNLTTHNDSRSVLLERSLGKYLARMGGASSDKIPKSMLSAMDKKGIRPVADANGGKFNYDGNGYVDKKPYGYEFTDGNGSKKIVMGDDFASEYKKNPILRKSFKKAYNMRFLGYNGKYMAKNFFSKFGLKRDGGLASKNSDLTKDNVNQKINDKLKTPTDLEKGNEGAKGKFKDRLTNLLKRSAKKASKAGGDPILTAGVAACVGINMPGFIAGTIRAVQVAQLLVLLNDVILSPAGAQQAGDIDGDKLALLGKKVTETGPDGKSALDSPILQSAMGINKNPINVSQYAPGLALLSNPAIQATSKLASDPGLKSTCQAINSPEAAVAAAGIEGAISAASAGTGAIVFGALKAIGKVAVGIGGIAFVIQKAQELGIIDAIANSAFTAFESFIGNFVEGAQYEDLGDALGTAAYAFYPAASLAGGAAPLKTDQVEGFSKVTYDVDNEYRQEDVATLSPFDVSSPYTFLGSIVSKLSLYSVKDNPLQSTLSVLGYIFRSPFGLLDSPVANAASAASNCDNAAAFGLDDDLAINPAGYPCVGIPSDYVDMSAEEVHDLVKDQLDPETGEPKEDSDISIMMGDCSEGDLDSVTGCTIDGTDARKRAAESLYMYDLQIQNIMSGEDSEVSTGGL